MLSSTNAAGARLTTAADTHQHHVLARAVKFIASIKK